MLASRLAGWMSRPRKNCSSVLVIPRFWRGASRWCATATANPCAERPRWPMARISISNLPTATKRRLRPLDKTPLPPNAGPARAGGNANKDRHSDKASSGRFLLTKAPTAPVRPELAFMVVRDLDQCPAMGDSAPRASAVGAESSARPGWRPTMKNTLNEEDFPLFTDGRRPQPANAGRVLRVCLGRQGAPPRCFLAAEMR